MVFRKSVFRRIAARTFDRALRFGGRAQRPLLGPSGIVASQNEWWRAIHRAWMTQTHTAAVIIFCSVSFSGSAASPPENEARRAAYVHCLQDAAAQLDDGTSEVTGVALAVKSMCAAQFTTAVEAYAQGMTFDDYQMLRNRLEAQRLSEAAEAVMRVRASRSPAMPSKPGTIRASQAPSAKSLAQAALAAYQRGHYTTALNLFHSLADQGDASAQNMLGLMYDDGKGVAQDYPEAVRWFRKAAKQGEPTAEFMVGLRYAEGRGLTQDYVEAVKWLRLAAAQREPHAQKALGRHLQSLPRSSRGAKFNLADGIVDCRIASRRLCRKPPVRLPHCTSDRSPARRTR